MENEIKVGDKVSLNSGGPAMTVNSIRGDEATCEWFDKEHKLSKENFKLTSLKLYSTPSIRAIKSNRRSNNW